MRGTSQGMSTTLLAAQKGIGVSGVSNKPYFQVVLSGASTVTYTTEDRVIRCQHIEEDDNGIATLTLDNSDGSLTSLDFEQYQGVISWGYNTSAGNEVSPTAPLKVIGQQFYSAPGYLLCNLYLIGIPNQMRRDKAIAEYTQLSTDTNTLKTLLTAVGAASTGLSSAFNGYTAVTITYEAGPPSYDDGIIDAFKPADFFSISVNTNRWDKITELLGYTGDKVKVEDDGELHILNPVTVDIGAEATNRATTVAALYTIIELSNPANASGTIGSIDIWAATNMTGLRVGTFYLVSGSTYKCRASVSIGNVTAGSKQTFTGLSLAVQTGDYIGYYCATGTLEFDTTGGSGIAYVSGEYIDAGDSTAFDNTTIPSGTISLGTNTFHYEYRFLVDTYHTFFNKTIRNRFVDPNKEIVASHPDHTPPYTGSATNVASYALAPKIHTTYRRLVSDAEAALIAAAIIGRNELDSESGSAIVPMNCGQEIWDYVKFTDAREGGDTKAGNVQYIERNVDVTKPMGRGGYDMTLRFGKASEQSQFELDSLTVGGGVNPVILNRINRLTDDIMDLYQNQYTMLTDGFRIDQTLIYGAGYDPTDKKRVFTATPTTPYDVGDLWVDATVIKRCTTARASGAYTAGDWTAQTLDSVADGTTYLRLLATNISSGRISLTAANYYSGKFSGEWYSGGVSGVDIDATYGINIYGTASALTTRATKTGTVQCYVGADGFLYAGAGSIWLSATEFGIKGATQKFYTGATLVGTIDGNALGLFITLPINTDFQLSASGTGRLDFLGNLIRTFTAIEEQGAYVNTLYDILPFDTGSWLGNSATKWARGYFTALPSCPEGLPTQVKGLDILKKIKSPVADGTGKVSFKDSDFPDEMKIDVENKIITEAVYKTEEVLEADGFVRAKRVEISPRKVDIIPTGVKEIEYIKTIGVLVQCQREMIARLEILEAR